MELVEERNSKKTNDEFGTVSDLTTFSNDEFGTILDLTTFLSAEFGTIME